MPRTGIYATLPLFFLKASYLSHIGLNDVCMHVVGYLVVFVFSQKKESRGEHLLLTHCRTLTPIDNRAQFGICGYGITETT